MCLRPARRQRSNPLGPAPLRAGHASESASEVTRKPCARSSAANAEGENVERIGSPIQERTRLLNQRVARVWLV